MIAKLTQKDSITENATAISYYQLSSFEDGEDNLVLISPEFEMIEVDCEDIWFHPLEGGDAHIEKYIKIEILTDSLVKIREMTAD